MAAIVDATYPEGDTFHVDGFDESETGSAIRSLIESGNIDELVAASSKLAPSFIKASLSYEFLDEHAREVDAFFTSALRSHELSPAEKFALSESFSWEYLTALVHLEKSYTTGALSNLEGCSFAISEVKTSLASSSAWSSGPDAAMDEQQAEELRRAARKLEEAEEVIASIVDSIKRHEDPH